MTYIELLWYYLYTCCCVHVTIFFFYYEGSNQTTMKGLVVLISLLSIVKSQSKYVFTCREKYVFQNRLHFKNNLESFGKKLRYGIILTLYVLTEQRLGCNLSYLEILPFLNTRLFRRAEDGYMIDWLNILERQLSSISAISMTRASSIAYNNIVMREWMVQPGQQFVTINGKVYRIGDKQCIML